MNATIALSDQIYRAAVSAAGHLGAPIETGTAARALAYELELRGLRVRVPDGGDRGDPTDVLVVEDHDGVCVSTSDQAADDLDIGARLQQHHWRRAHAVVFGAHALHVKTVVG